MVLFVERCQFIHSMVFCQYRSQTTSNEKEALIEIFDTRRKILLKDFSAIVKLLQDFTLKPPPEDMVIEQCKRLRNNEYDPYRRMVKLLVLRTLDTETCVEKFEDLVMLNPDEKKYH